MLKKAIIVCGPESAGNHLVASLLNSRSEVSTPGDKDEVHTLELLKTYVEHRYPSTIIVQRSMPCDKKWWSLEECVRLFRKYNYEISLIILSREWGAMARSQAHKHIPKTIDEAVANIRDAYSYIFRQMIQLNLPFIIVNYEALILNKKMTLKYVRLFLDIEFNDSNIDVKNKNEKWY